MASTLRRDGNFQVRGKVHGIGINALVIGHWLAITFFRDPLGRSAPSTVPTYPVDLLHLLLHDANYKTTTHVKSM